jgi:hypothetical protein
VFNTSTTTTTTYNTSKSTTTTFNTSTATTTVFNTSTTTKFITNWFSPAGKAMEGFLHTYVYISGGRSGT